MFNYFSDLINETVDRSFAQQLFLPPPPIRGSPPRVPAKRHRPRVRLANAVNLLGFERQLQLRAANRAKGGRPPGEHRAPRKVPDHGGVLRQGAVLHRPGGVRGAVRKDREDEHLRAREPAPLLHASFPEFPGEKVARQIAAILIG